jgi:hypothetical protein
MNSPLRKIVLIAFLFLFVQAYAQTNLVKLKSRTFQPEQNVAAFNYQNLSNKNNEFGGSIFCIIQFNEPVTQQQKQMLANVGIDLFHYIPDNTFTAVIRKNAGVEFLKKQNITSISELSIEDKLSKKLFKNQIPSWAVKQANKVDVIVHFSKGITPVFAKDYFIAHQYQLIEEAWSNYGFVTLRIDQHNINNLATIPFVEYIEPIAPDPKTFNYVMRTNTRANVLNAPVSAGGEGLRGKDVTIGIGDDADPSDHVDLRDRVINRAAGIQQTHGTHVAGIAAGGGLKDPMFQGVAPLATIVGQLFNGIFLNAAAYIADYRMVVTNNSWGNITGECDLTGVYDTYSKLMDDISIQYPYLLNVFAAGNDGPFTCLGYQQQYHTIVSGHQSAKNVLSVGWSEKNQTVSALSSIGPTADGRLKPEITSQGSGLRSTAPSDDYFTDWGTSMAAPTVAGGAALLIEKYRQLNSGADPKSGLVKALLMNGARDIENKAPDYKSGYGYLYLVRSLDMLKNNRHISSMITQGETKNHNILVPAGVSQLKVMIYWHDPAAAIFAQNALVNDLDIELVTPSSSVVLPWILQKDSINATANATRGVDHLNNSEQITIDDPVAGNYNIRVKATGINSGAAQEYFIVYDFVPTGVVLTYPSVNEPLVPGETIVVNWDAWGESANNFTLEYSTDNGINWINISNSIPANARQFEWIVPNISTEHGKMRISRNGTNQSDISQPFLIISQPTLSLSAIQCEDYINVEWNAINSATDYEVMMKQGAEMISIGNTTNTHYIFSGLQADTTYWVSVRARINGKPGRRAVAISRKPNSGNCSGSISDNDLKLDSIISPNTGRQFTSTAITTNSLAIRIKNLDDAPVTGFSVQYSINGSTFITENVSTTIPAQAPYDHTFSGMNFANQGDYNIIAVVKNNTTDNNPINDTLRQTIRHLANAPVTLPYIENFDAAPAFEITDDITGLPSLERWDFINTNNSGRLRSFVNTGIAKNGNRALTLDVSEYTASGNTNYLIGTFNLSNYSNINPSELGLKLSFSYKHHGQNPHPDNRVWIRRNDTDPWIQVFNFDSLNLRPGEWKSIAIHLANTAAAIGPTSSFQVRFGQHGNLSMGDEVSNGGITIDDVKLTSNPYDVELVSIDSPSPNSCGLSNAVPIKIRYIDHRGVSGCIPVKYRVDNGAVISECIISNGTGDYTFAAKANLSSIGSHLIEVWSDHPADTYRSNDTVRMIIRNKPVITVYPYIENFENNSAGWHTEGYKSSWELGTPSSLKIRTAASGTKAWKTTLRGQYNENENSYLYSPCYDISSLSSPYLSFNMALDMEQCNPFVCDKLWMEYSSDGKTWNKLGNYGQGINWYNNKTENVWDSANYTKWHIAGISLLTSSNPIQLRFVLQSDASVTREGVAIDDIQVFDQQISNDPGWMIYPNPVNNILQIVSNHSTGSTVTLSIFDASGRTLFLNNFTATGLLDKNTLNLSRLPAGLYALRISDGINNKVFKIIKQ